MNELLGIVHLSSIDSFLEYYGVYPAMKLAVDLKMAVLSHPGRTIILDQGWDEIAEDAKYMRQSVLDLERLVSGVTVLHHDELADIDPWTKGMAVVAKHIKAMNPSRIRLGGLWASVDGKSGCVHEVQRQVRSRLRLPCYVDYAIVGLEEKDQRASIGCETVL